MRLANRVPRIVFAITMSLSLVACSSSGDDDDDDIECYDDPAACVAPGADTQLVADGIIMPTSATQAQQLGIDLDGDPQGRPDNALGQILSTLASQGDLDLQMSVDESVASGSLILLLNLRATGLTTAPDIGTWVYLGENPDPAACMDPDVIETCGQHLAGGASFDISAASPTDAVLHGNIIGGKLVAGPGKITLELSLGGAAAITINMIGARIEATVDPETGALTDGKIGGAITEQELDDNVLPALVTVMQENVGDDCTGSPPDCCIEGSTGETLIDLFDDCSDDSSTCDCAITLDELRNNDLISSLLSPDVDLLDDEDGSFNPREHGSDGVKDALSLGIGFSSISAIFTPPPQ